MASKSRATVRKAESPRLAILPNPGAANTNYSDQTELENNLRKQQLRKALPPPGSNRNKYRAEANLARKICEARNAKKGYERDVDSSKTTTTNARAEDETLTKISSKIQRDIFNRIPGTTASGLNKAERSMVSEVWVDQMLGHHVQRGAEEGVSSINAKARLYLKENGLDRPSLERDGLCKDEIDRMYRAMYVYSIGFHQCVTDIVKQSTVAQPELVGRIWRTYSRLLELSEKDHGGNGVAVLEKNHAAAIAALKESFRKTEEAWKDKVENAHFEVSKADARASAEENRRNEIALSLQEAREELALSRLAMDQEIARHADTAKELDSSRNRLAQLSKQMREEALERSRLDAQLVQYRDALDSAEKASQNAQSQRQKAYQKMEELRQQSEKADAEVKEISRLLQESEQALEAKTIQAAFTQKKLSELQNETNELRSGDAERVRQVRELRFERNRLQRLLNEEEKKFQDIRYELEAEITEHGRACEELNRVTETCARLEGEYQSLNKEHATLQERADALETKLGKTQQLNQEFREELDRSSLSVSNVGSELDSMAGKFEQETKQRLKVEEALRKRTMELATSVDTLAQVKRSLNDRADAATEAKKRITVLENKITIERTNGQERLRRANEEANGLRSQISKLQVDLEALRQEKGTELASVNENANQRVQVIQQEIQDLKGSIEGYQAMETLFNSEFSEIARLVNVKFTSAMDCVPVRDAVSACVTDQVTFRERCAISEQKISAHAEILRNATQDAEAKARLAGEVERLEGVEEDLRTRIMSLELELEESRRSLREAFKDLNEATDQKAAGQKHIESLKFRLGESKAMIADLEKERESIAKHSDELIESMTAEIERVSALKSANVALEAELQAVLSKKPKE